MEGGLAYARSGISHQETQPKGLPATVFQALPEHNAPMQAQPPDKKRDAP